MLFAYAPAKTEHGPWEAASSMLSEHYIMLEPVLEGRGTRVLVHFVLIISSVGLGHPKRL